MWAVSLKWRSEKLYITFQWWDYNATIALGAKKIIMSVIQHVLVLHSLAMKNQNDVPQCIFTWKEEEQVRMRFML